MLSGSESQSTSAHSEVRQVFDERAWPVMVSTFSAMKYFSIIRVCAVQRNSRTAPLCQRILVMLMKCCSHPSPMSSSLPSSIKSKFSRNAASSKSI